MDSGLRMSSTRPPVSDEALPSPDLNDREHGKDHLSGETDRSGGRFVRGKLVRERSTEHGTQSDLSRHQHQDRLPSKARRRTSAVGDINRAIWVAISAGPSPPRRHRPPSWGRTAGSKTAALQTGDRGFESRSLQRRVARTTPVAYPPGTDGSNPFPSSSESSANLTFGAITLEHDPDTYRSRAASR